MRNVEYYDDFSLTHEDEAYMQRNYDVRLEQKDNYFVRTYPQWCVCMRGGQGTSLTCIAPTLCLVLQPPQDRPSPLCFYCTVACRPPPPVWSCSPQKIEMSFNLSTYQPHLKEAGLNIYQTYFLNGRWVPCTLWAEQPIQHCGL